MCPFVVAVEDQTDNILLFHVNKLEALELKYYQILLKISPKKTFVNIFESPCR